MIAELRRLKARRPFLPFTIHRTDGEKLRVPTVGHFAVAPTGARVIVFAEDDSTILVSALVIAKITVDPESTAQDA